MPAHGFWLVESPYYLGTISATVVFIRSLLTILSRHVMNHVNRPTTYQLKATELPENYTICVFHLAGVGKKKYTWSQDDMKAAFDALKNQHISVYAAAKRYGLMSHA